MIGRMPTIDVSRTVAAPLEVVWEVVADHRGMVEYTNFRKVELEREGDPAPNGLGAIRVLHLVGPPVREEVVAFEAPHRLVYTMLSGAPLKPHVGTVELSPVAGGTRMGYVVETSPPKLFGPLGPALVRKLVGDTAAGIAGEAEKRAAG